MKVLSRRAVTVGTTLAALGMALGAAAGSAAGQSAPAAGGRVLAKGPGYSIVATSPAKGRPPAASEETRVTDAPLETLHEPIVCQGQRVLHIDNRDIRFDGNAITAEDGCELHITNSRISAARHRHPGAGTPASTSRTARSKGSKASIDAIARRADLRREHRHSRAPPAASGEAAIHDLGNNAWN